MTLRIGIIGSGFVGQHINALKKIDDVLIVAICSRNEKKARSLVSNNVNYYVFDNYLEMLRKENLDAVYICLPPFLLSEIVMTCADYVKALFIEKPIGIEISAAHRVMESLDKVGTIVSVGYMCRYRKTLQMAKDFFTKEPPILINGGWCSDLPPPYWWRQRGMSGGQLTEQCTHFLDAIRFIAGEVDEVSAFSASGFIDDVNDFNVDDAITMNFRLESGAVGNVMTSCFSRTADVGLGLFLNFSSRDKKFLFHDHCLNLNIHRLSGEKQTFFSKDDAILEENLAFIHAVKTGDLSNIRSNYKDALESLKLSLAVDISIQEKRSVKISEFS